MSAALNIKRDCHCPRARHQHGTTSAYRSCGCRCDQCREANRRYQTRHLMGATGADATGETFWADGATVRRQLEAIRAAGHTIGEIAQVMGVSRNRVNQLRQRKFTRVTTLTAHRVSSAARHFGVVGLAPIEHGARVDPTGAARKAQALAYAGWTTREIAAAAGLTHSCVSDVQNGTPSIAEGTRVAIDAAYRTLMGRAQTNSARAASSRARAQRLGWLPAAAWEDDAAMDDPDALPLASRHWWGRQEALPSAVAARMHAATVERARRKREETAA